MEQEPIEDRKLMLKLSIEFHEDKLAELYEQLAELEQGEKQ